MKIFPHAEQFTSPCGYDVYGRTVDRVVLLIVAEVDCADGYEQRDLMHGERVGAHALKVERVFATQRSRVHALSVCPIACAGTALADFGPWRGCQKTCAMTAAISAQTGGSRG